MKPQTLIVADPVSGAAQLIADQCRRLANTRRVTVTIDDAILAATELQPEILVISLELSKSQPEAYVKKIRDIVPGALFIATFREITLPTMEKLRRAGVDEFVPQPVDATNIYCLASSRFDIAVRQHERFSIEIDVLRADGEVLGKTANISEGGMCLDAVRPVFPGNCFLVYLNIPPAPQPMLGVRFRVLTVEGTLPMRARGCFENLRGESHRRLAAFLNESKESEDRD